MLRAFLYKLPVFRYHPLTSQLIMEVIRMFDFASEASEGGPVAAHPSPSDYDISRM